MEGTSTIASAGKAPKPFLRRGEGVEKRVFASRYRKAITPVPATTTNSSNGSASWGASESATGRRSSQQDPTRTQSQSDAWSWDGKSTELASETRLLRVDQPPDGRMDAGPISNRFLRNSLKAAWASRQAEEELELEEFKALETQIKADVVGATRTRADQGAQALPSSSSLLPSGPVRSYAAIHQQQQRPPQPSQGASRSSSRCSDQAARTHAGWASPQPAGRHRYQDASGTGTDVDVDDDYASNGVGQTGSDQHGCGDDGCSAWGQQQQQQQQHSPGKPGAAPGGGKGSAVGPASWGQEETDGAASMAEKARLDRGFDDADAWNDTNSFLGGGGAAACGVVRKGGAVASAGNANNGNRTAVRSSAFFGGHSRSPNTLVRLNDPWATPAAGEDQYGTGQEVLMDDCTSWSADQQQKLQPQPVGQPKGASDEDRGPDQPFVRALFSKQQQQQQRLPLQPGGSRTAGKGAAGKARAVEPLGPSPAELERMQVLEEQLANVASERSTLVRMRTELEKAANRLEQERQAWEKSRAEEQAKWEAQRDAEEAKLRRDRRVLEKQSKALLKLPNKKERTAMEAAEAALEAERREGRAREARHKLTVERLRRQLVELQERNHELREEVRWHEAQQLERGWGGAGGAAGGSGSSTKGGTPCTQVPTKPRPGRTIAVQTEPLAFLPPLDSVGAGPAGQPDTASSRSTCMPFGGPQRMDGSSEGPPAGGRPNSSGVAMSASTGRAGVGSRLRGMQTIGRGAAAAVSASQPGLPASWRAEREVMRKSGGAVHGQRDREQAHDVDEEYDTLCSEEGMEVGEEAVEEGHVELGRDEGQGATGRGGGSGGRGRDSAYGWGRGSPSSYSYAQNDGAEVLTDEAGGPDGLYADGVSTLAWQQHQDFMARAGLAPEEGRRAVPTSSSSPRQGHAVPSAAEARLKQQRQPPPPPPWVRASEAAASPNAPEEFGAQQQRPAISGRISRPTELQQQQQQQQQQQPQQPCWSAYTNNSGMRQGSCGPAGVVSMPQRAVSDQRGSPAWTQTYPDQVPATTGSRPGPILAPSPPGSPPRWPAQGPGPGPGRGGGGQRPDGKGTVPNAFFGLRGEAAAPAGAAPRAAATTTRPFPAPSSSSSSSGQAAASTTASAAPAVVVMAAGSGRSGFGRPSSPEHPSSPLRDSVAALDGVSQTLAALRMDRQVEAVAAAAAAIRADGDGVGSTGSGSGNSSGGGGTSVAWGGGPGLGRPTSYFAGDQGGPAPAGQHSTAQRGGGGDSQQQQRPGAFSTGPSEEGCSADAWSPRSHGARPNREPTKSQTAPGAPSAWGPASSLLPATDGVAPQRHTQTAQDYQRWQGFPSLNAAQQGQQQQQQGQPQQKQHMQPPQQGLQQAVQQPPRMQQAVGFGGNNVAATTTAAAAAAGAAPVQWPSSVMTASAAGAASVAHSVSYQQHLQGARARPPGAHQVTSVAAVGEKGGGGGDGDGCSSRVGSGGGAGAGGVGGTAGDALLREVRHADGKTERLYASGIRLVLFANGTRKVALPDGSSRVYFANGDVKWAVPSAAAAAAASLRSPSAAATTASLPPPPPDVSVVHYYYAEVGTWHSTYGGEGGVEVFYFPSGQTEAHHPGHGKEIMFPDGVLRVVTTDGEEMDINWQQLSWAVQQPQPRVDGLGDNEL